MVNGNIVFSSFINLNKLSNIYENFFFEVVNIIIVLNEVKFDRVMEQYFWYG